MDLRTEKEILRIQKEEITACEIYTRLSRLVKDEHNRAILTRIGGHERKHYEILRKYSGREIGPSRFRISLFVTLARVLGLSFSLKLMERAEKRAGTDYQVLGKEVKELSAILKDEEKHEMELLAMLDEEGLRYMGSVVLGLNDALVELSGALAGFTFAIQNSRTIALMGLITGIAATLSMAASEFLSQRQDEENRKTALKSALYTGIAYVGTVILLVLPYFLITQPFLSLVLMLVTVILIIFLFNFYISVARDLPLARRFWEMVLISLSVALVSFGIGWLVKNFLGLEI